MVDYNKVGKLIIASLQKELIGQGHQATGNLVNSFEQRVVKIPNSVALEILMDDYGTYVNDGRKAGGKKVPISVLIEWIERKAIVNGNKEVKSLAFAIQQTIHKEGTPTSGSFKFSFNGRRDGFIDFVIENELDGALAELEKEVFENADETVAEIVRDFNKRNK
jgi:hypothetical protein